MPIYYALAAGKSEELTQKHTWKIFFVIIYAQILNFM